MWYWDAGGFGGGASGEGEVHAGASAERGGQDGRRDGFEKVEVGGRGRERGAAGEGGGGCRGDVGGFVVVGVVGDAGDWGWRYVVKGGEGG